MLGGLFAGVGFAAGHHHARAGEHEAFRQREADAAGAARHDDGAAGHVEETVKRCAVHAVSKQIGDVAATYCSTVWAGVPVICATSSVRGCSGPRDAAAPWSRCAAGRAAAGRSGPAPRAATRRGACPRRSPADPARGSTARRCRRCRALRGRSARRPAPMWSAGSRSTAATTRATSAAAIGDVRPLPNGSTSAPRSRIEGAASIVNNGFSRNTVGRTWTTGRPDQFMMCSASQCSRCWWDSGAGQRHLRHRHLRHVHDDLERAASSATAQTSVVASR